MASRTAPRLAALAAIVSLAASGCSRDAGVLRPWPLSTDPVVFRDVFTGAVEFQAFGNSKFDALGTDNAEQFDGTGCLKVTVPNPGAGYAGGAFVAREERDLSGNNALTFYVKASRAVTMDVAGFGNDNTGRSRFEARVNNLALTTTWRRVVLPVPSPGRLAAERGLFYFAASPQSGSGYTVWIDEVKFERLSTITNPRPAMSPQTLDWFIGSTVNVSGTRSTFNVDGADVTVTHMPGYFDYTSSDPAVATVADGVIRLVGAGTATITARLDTALVSGTVTLNAVPFAPGSAPVPTVPAANVVSLFSNVYSNVTVDKWSADWDVANVSDLSVFGDDLKLYTGVSYAGIEFISRPIDATSMTHFHMDIWVPSGTLFRVKLVDFGSNRVFGGGDDSQHELTFDAGSSPPLATGAWVGLEIPFAAFTGLTGRAHLAQLVLSGDTRTVYVDNIYFHR
jgi:hypothetical protein